MSDHNPNRRRLIFSAGKLGIAGLCLHAAGHPAWSNDASTVKEHGCILAARELKQVGGYLTLPSSGLPRIDHAVEQELKSLRSVFGVDAEFAFINDDKGENAFAISRTTASGPKVLLGIRLMHHVLGSLSPVSDEPVPARFPSASAGTLAAILAHEWAHQLQFNYKVVHPQPTASPMELHADFLAGWYMGKKNLSTMDDEADLERDFRSLGDNNFTDPDHHGTPAERAEAFLGGYQLARSSDSSIQSAMQQGAKRYGLSFA